MSSQSVAGADAPHATISDRAKAYIDAVLEINQKHGMGGSVAEDVYETAVRSAAAAVEELRSLAKLHEAAG